MFCEEALGLGVEFGEGQVVEQPEPGPLMMRRDVIFC